MSFLAEEQVAARTARLYIAHLGRFATWLREQYHADLVDATSHDLREYRSRLADRQKPASVNAALAALQRFYGWARDAGRVRMNPAGKLKPIASQPLARKVLRRSSGNAFVARRSGPDQWSTPS